MEKTKRKRGAPKGNQNAPKHGFYSKTLDKAQRLNLKQARGLDGLDEEIAILRLKLREIIKTHHERLQLALEAANSLARLVSTRYSISKGQQKSFKEAIAKVLSENRPGSRN